MYNSGRTTNNRSYYNLTVIMRRNLLGIIAVALLVSGAVGLKYGYSEQSITGMSAGVGIRAGLVLGALWLAYPQLVQLTAHMPAWLFGALAVGGLAVVIRFRNIVLVGPILAVIVALHFASRIFKPLSKPARKRPPDQNRPTSRSESGSK